MSDSDKEATKKSTYAPPRILQTQKITARAIQCARNDDTSCSSGPLAS